MGCGVGKGHIKVKYIDLLNNLSIYLLCSNHRIIVLHPNLSQTEAGQIITGGYRRGLGQIKNFSCRR